MRKLPLLTVVTMIAAIGAARAQDRRNLAPLETLSKIHQDYLKRAREAGESVADRLALAKWALERKMYNDARIEFDNVLSRDPDHAWARAAMGFRKSGGGWEVDTALLAKDVSVTIDPEAEKRHGNTPLYREMVEFLKKPETRETIIREIRERTGFHRFPGELDAGIMIAADVQNDAFAITTTPGYTADEYRLKVTVLLNAKKMLVASAGRSMEFLRRTTRHELVHALCMPAANKWSSWVNEGLASYVGREEFQIREMVADGFDDIEAKPKTYIQNYARGYLLWEYIEKKYGQDAVTKIVREMVLHYRPFPQIAADIAGKTWAEFKSDLVAYGKQRIGAFAAQYGVIEPSSPWLGVLPWWEAGDEVVVCFTTPGSGALKSGIHGGDVITHVDRRPVNGCKGLVEFLGKKKAGETVRITLKRDGKSVDVEATLGPAPTIPKGEFVSVRQIL